MFTLENTYFLKTESKRIETKFSWSFFSCHVSVLSQQWLTKGIYKQGDVGMRGTGQMVYGELKWGESPFTGSCLSAPG